MSPRRIALLAVAALFACVPPAAAHDDEPLVIGHRGAPGYLPDHTLEGYALAIRLGADYIEPDLVATKDGHLIARHEPNLIATTDVASKFPERKRTAIVDGFPEEGYFASDFTLKEINTLRAVQPLADRPQQFNGAFKIPTFEEVLALAKRRHVGIYPETKHPTYHQNLGLALEGRLVAALVNEGDRKLLPPTSLIQRAHRKGLLIHTWTFRNEDRFLAYDYRGNPLKEYLQFFRFGIDGVFSDFTDTAVFARRLFD